MTFEDFKQNVYEQVLNEMPVLTKSWSPTELLDLDKNKETYLSWTLELKKHKLFDLNNGNSTVYEHFNNFVCLDRNLEEVTYDMTFEKRTHPKLGEYVWQYGVWVQEGYSYLQGLASRMFFDKLLKEHPVILTDSVQSWDGKRFWMNCIGKAFEKELNVYFFDFKTEELIKMETHQQWKRFNQEHKDIWGKTDRHKMKRMIITSEML